MITGKTVKVLPTEITLKSKFSTIAFHVERKNVERKSVSFLKYQEAV